MALDPHTDADLESLIKIRRHLHQIPELRFRAHKTAEYLKSLVKPLADRTVDGVAGTGIVAVIEGSPPGPKVLLRADMDAYPVTEAADVPYAATCEGTAHVCGHDVHMTVMVGVLGLHCWPDLDAGEVRYRPVDRYGGKRQFQI